LGGPEYLVTTPFYRQFVSTVGDEMTRVFVYGSLREGERSHDLLHGATKIGDALLPGYDLFKVAWYPGIKRNPDSTVPVVGEVYEVTDTKREMLDCYEGVDVGLFRRETVEIEGLPTEVYEYNRSTDFKFCERIESGDWKQCD
jgi:gamma-glutamylaminecyclotransferase